MKKLCSSVLILLVLFLTGCSLGTKVAMPIEEDNEMEPSELQQTLEKFIANNEEVEETVDGFMDAVENVLEGNN